MCSDTSSACTWKTTLHSLDLPPIDELILDPPPYPTWKKTIQDTIAVGTQRMCMEAVAAKTSLGLWNGRLWQRSPSLYPLYLANPALRHAVVIRSQLLCQVYLTQARMFKIGRSPDGTCRLCSLAIEDVTHMIGTCTCFSPLRKGLIHRISTNPDLIHLTPYFDDTDPSLFTTSVLLLPSAPIIENKRHILNILILYFLRNLHTTRLQILSSQ